MKIGLKNISYAYTRNAPVLTDLSLEIPLGITLLKGYSGCGKSTVLRLISGYLSPQKGAVSVPPNQMKPDRRFLKQHLGFVFQDINLIPDSTVKRNIDLSRALGGIHRDQLHEALEQSWLDKLGLSDLVDRKVKTLSGGQKQRAAMARAILKDPLVLCLDEPTSGLDDHNTSILKDSLRDFIKREKIVVIATHDSRLDEIADKIVNFESAGFRDPEMRRS